MYDPTELLGSLPSLPGVYRMLDEEGGVLYVGKARDLKKRVSSYFQKSQLAPRIQLMLAQVAQIDTTVTRSEAEALLLENNLIKALNPRYNILFRDDKSYPYIALSGHTFPRMAFQRGNPGKGGQFFGPFPNAIAVRESLHLLQKVFRLRTCEDSVFTHRTRPCLLYQIKRCTGPCVGLIDAERYSEDVRHAAAFLSGKEQEVLEALERRMLVASEAQAYEQAAAIRDQLQALRKVQERQFVDSGDEAAEADVVAIALRSGLVCVNLTMVRAGRHLGDKTFFPQNAEGHDAAEVVEAFVLQHYDDKPIPRLILLNVDFDTEAVTAILNQRAARRVKVITRPIGTRRVWVDMAEKNATLAIAQRLAQTATQEARLTALIEALDLPETTQRIECFDISHTQGEATVASCVVYDRTAMQHSEYRRYNVAGITPGDDYAAMRDALTRRYRKLAAGEGRLPDLLLIDGGRGQVGVAREVLAELGVSEVELIGVAKGPARKAGMEELVFADERKPIQLNPDHPGSHLIQQIRDEAHRFAITGHRARRGKKRTHSVLDDIEGIGPKRRQLLIMRFGGLKGVMDASVDELAKVAGVSRALAEKIYGALH